MPCIIIIIYHFQLIFGHNAQLVIVTVHTASLLDQLKSQFTEALTQSTKAAGPKAVIAEEIGIRGRPVHNFHYKLMSHQNDGIMYSMKKRKMQILSLYSKVVPLHTNTFSLRHLNISLDSLIATRVQRFAARRAHT